MTNLPRPRSGPLTTGPARAPQRAMLRAVGLSEDDLRLPQVAVASSWNEVTPCNLHLNVPAAFLYGGTILPGHALGRSLTIQDVFEAVGAQAAGDMSDADLLAVERAACPGAGSCAGMYTANTMSACSEALGLALPGAASPPAVSAERKST